MKGAVARRERLPLLLFVLLSLVLLALARPLGCPWPLRTIAALTAVFLLPGAALALLWPGASRSGWPAVAALAAPLSLLPLLAAGTFGSVFDWGVLPLGAAYLFGVFVVALASLVLAWRREAEESPPRWVAFAFGVLLLAAALLALRAGAPSGPLTDGPDHIATVGEILDVSEYFPRQGLTPPGTVDRTDPRKGILHVGLALAASLAGVPASAVWSVAPAVLLASWLAGLLALGRRLGLEWRGALLAVALAFLFMGGGGGAWALRIGYGAHFALALAWAGTWVLVGLVEDFQRSQVILLGLLTLAAAAVHPMAPAFLFLPALLMLPLLRGDRILARRVLGALAGAVGIAAPVLIWRLGEAWGPINPLHRETMPTLHFGSGWTMLWPPDLLRGLGWVGLLGLALLPTLRRSVGERVGRSYLAAAAAASVLPAAVPGLFDLAARATSSLAIKLLYLNPFFFVLAAFLTGSWRGRGLWPRALTALLLLAALPGAWGGFAAGRGAGWRPAGVDGALELLRAIPSREVVVADPWTSSLIAAETYHFPITVYHQHGHPLDASGLQRLNELNAILCPWLPADDARARMRAARARFVLLSDGTMDVPRRGFGAAVGGPLTAARLAKFSEAAPAFVEFGRVPGWVLLRAADGGRPAGRLPVLACAQGEPRGVPVSREDGSACGVRLRSAELPAVFTRGGETPVVLWWETRGEGSGWPVEAHLRLAPIASLEGGKLSRVFEILMRGERSPGGPHRAVLSPFLGAWPSPWWPREGALADSQRVALPAGLPPGKYAVSLRVLEEPMFTRLAYRDIWSAQDRWQGAWIDTVELR